MVIAMEAKRESGEVGKSGLVTLARDDGRQDVPRD
jgi:hypothetical protein